jgi:hypothetical protein
MTYQPPARWFISKTVPPTSGGIMRIEIKSNALDLKKEFKTISAIAMVINKTKTATERNSAFVDMSPSGLV